MKLDNNRGQVGIGTLIVFIALVLVAAIAAGVLINTAGFLQTQAEQTGEDSTDQVADNINVIGEVGEVADSSDGSVGLSENKIFETTLTIQRSPGSSEVDLSGLSIQYVGDNGFAQLTHVSEQKDAIDSGSGGGTSAATNVYFIQSVTAETPGDPVITADGDRYEIVIPTGTVVRKVSGPTTEVRDTTGGGGSKVVANGFYGDGSDVVLDIVTLAGTAPVDIVDNSELSLLDEGQQAELEITTDSGATRNVVITAPDTFVGKGGDTVTL